VVKRFLALAVVVALLAPGIGQALAATPRDVLVMAKRIDDIITLDPAEIFEFSGAEYAANVYDRLITYDLRDVSRLEGGVAESWTVSEDGRTFTFTIRRGMAFHSGNPVTADDATCSPLERHQVRKAVVTRPGRELVPASRYRLIVLADVSLRDLYSVSIKL